MKLPPFIIKPEELGKNAIISYNLKENLKMESIENKVKTDAVHMRPQWDSIGNTGKVTHAESRYLYSISNCYGL